MGPFYVLFHDTFEGNVHAIASGRVRVHRLEERFNVEVRRIEWGCELERFALSIYHIPVVVSPAWFNRVSYTRNLQARVERYYPHLHQAYLGESTSSMSLSYASLSVIPSASSSSGVIVVSSVQKSETVDLTGLTRYVPARVIVGGSASVSSKAHPISMIS
jgi:hypothetical protein